MFKGTLLSINGVAGRRIICSLHGEGVAGQKAVYPDWIQRHVRYFKGPVSAEEIHIVRLDQAGVLL